MVWVGVVLSGGRGAGLAMLLHWIELVLGDCYA